MFKGFVLDTHTAAWQKLQLRGFITILLAIKMVVQQHFVLNHKAFLAARKAKRTLVSHAATTEQRVSAVDLAGTMIKLVCFSDAPR